LGQSVKKNKIIKKGRLEELLGCDILFFRKYLEKLFQEGMNWENYGEWHVDHIIPIDYFTKNFDFNDIEIQKK
jgi:hypothetical protein